MHQNLQQESNGEITLKELIIGFQVWAKYIFKHWLIILGVIISGSLLGFLYSQYKKPVYTATTTFVLEEDKAGGGGLGSLAGLASMAGIDLGTGGGGIFQGDNIQELYKSRSMIQKTLLTPSPEDSGQLLIDRYIKINKLPEKWSDNPELLSLKFRQDATNFSRLQDSIIGVAVEDIRKYYLSVGRPDKKLSIVKVDVKSKDEFFAKAFNDEIVKNVNAFYVETKTKKSLKNVQILQRKTDSVRAVMRGAIYSAATIADATPNLNPTRQVQRAAPVQNAQFSAEMNKAILAELVKNLELTKMSLLKETPLIQVVDNPVFPLKQEKLRKSEGIIFGGFIAGFIIVVGLLARRFYQLTFSPARESAQI